MNEQWLIDYVKRHYGKDISNADEATKSYYMSLAWYELYD